MGKLTDKQQAFVQEYPIDLNGTKAAIRAGYSPNTANTIAAKLLAKDNIQAALKVQLDKRAEQTQIDANYVLTRLAEIDQMDAADIVDADGNLKPLKDWPKIWRQMISGLDVKVLKSTGEGESAIQSVLHKIKWPDKVRNLDMIGKHVDVQAWKEKIDMSVTGTLADALREADGKADSTNS